MTHSSRNPTGWVQSGPGPGLSWQSRAQGWGPGSLAERVYPPPPHATPAPTPSRSLRQAARPLPGVVRTLGSARGPERTPGGLGPGHASEAAKQGRALCRGQAAGRLVPVPLPAPVPPLPPDSCGRSALAAPRPRRRRRRRAGRRRF